MHISKCGLSQLSSQSFACCVCPLDARPVRVRRSVQFIVDIDPSASACKSPVPDCGGWVVRELVSAKFLVSKNVSIQAIFLTFQSILQFNCLTIPCSQL